MLSTSLQHYMNVTPQDGIVYVNKDNFAAHGSYNLLIEGTNVYDNSLREVRLEVTLEPLTTDVTNKAGTYSLTSSLIDLPS